MMDCNNKCLVSIFIGERGKYMKKIICLLLAFVMLISVSVPTFAQNLEIDQMNIIDENNDLDSFEIIQIGNIYYMYLENNEDIVCITVNSEGNLVNAYSRKQNIEDKMLEYKPKSTLNLEESILHTNKLLNNEESKSIDTDINNILDLFNNNDFIETREINIETSYEGVLDSGSRKDENLNSEISLLNSGESSKAIRKAKNRYGDTVLNKYLTKGTYKGRTGYLYYTRTFGAYRTINKYVAAGLALSAISVMLGIPPVGVKQVVALVAGAGGTLVSLKAETVRKYKTTCYNCKEVKVGSIYPYRSLKDYVGEVLISSTGVSDFYYKKTKTSDNLYNNNSAIIKKGCELY